MAKNMCDVYDETGSGGISRRQMLLGAGAIAAGYTVGQLTTGASVAFGAYTDALTPLESQGACEWPTTAMWDAKWGSFEVACQEAAIRSYERYKSGGG